MGGFTDYDYGRDGWPTPRRRRRVTPPRAEPFSSWLPRPEPEIFTATAALPRAAATDRQSLELAQERLHAQATQHLDAHGYVATNMVFTTDPPSDATGTVTVRLEMETAARTDGEWPSVRQAIAEDAADRAEALAGKTAVDDRLDALRASTAAWWAETPAKVSEALSGRFQQSPG